MSNPNKYEWPTELAEYILENFKEGELFNSEIEKWMLVPTPELKLLKQLLFTVYQASLLPEEGRFPKFNVIYYPDSEITAFYNTIKFKEKIEFNLKQINTLAPVINYKSQYLILESDLKIAGILDISEDYYNSIKEDDKCKDFEPPYNLIISVESMGYLVIKKGGHKIATYFEGKIIKHQKLENLSAEFIFLKFKKTSEYVDSKIKKMLPKWKNEIKLNPYPFYKLLFHTIRRISDAHHGGAIIVIPFNKTKKKYPFKIKYPCSYNKFLEEYIVNTGLVFLHENKHLLNEIELKKYKKVQTFSADIRMYILKYSNLLSSLANVDGAILINDRLELLGFGVEIQCIDYKNDEIVAFDSSNSLKKISTKDYGTRHRSAFRFVQKNNDCFVLLSSQDGGMKCIGFDEKAKSVTMWEDLING